MKVKLTILAAFAAFLALGAETPKAAEPKPGPAPVLNTSKLWRMIAQAQAKRQEALQTPQAKAADAADLEVQQEQQRLAGLCGPSHVLGYQQDAKAENAGDIVCVDRPVPPPAQAATPPATPKEK